MLLPDGPLGDGVVALRAWRADDAEWYAAAAADPEILRWTGEPDGLTTDAARAAIVGLRFARPHAGLAIVDAATGTPLGNAGLACSAGDPHTGQISYWLAPGARGRGSATRAVRLLIGWAWQCGLRRVTVYTHIDNTASQRVAERAGLIRNTATPNYRIINGQLWTVAAYQLDRPTATIVP